MCTTANDWTDMSAVHTLVVVAVSAKGLCLNHVNSAIDSLILLKISLMMQYGIDGLQD